jgi:hypothetical protein
MESQGTGGCKGALICSSGTVKWDAHGFADRFNDNRSPGGGWTFRTSISQIRSLVIVHSQYMRMAEVHAYEMASIKS